MNLRTRLINVIANPKQRKVLSLKRPPQFQERTLNRLSTEELKDLLFENYSDQLHAAGIMGPMFIHMQCHEFRNWLEQTA